MSKVSPTARTLAECRKRGWIAQVVEQTIPRTFIKRDFLGCIDIIAITPSKVQIASPCCVMHAPYSGESFTCRTCGKTNAVEPSRIVGIQATSNNGGNHSARVQKILAEPRASAWLGTGAKIAVWSWAKRGARGKRKTWALREEWIMASENGIAWSET